jgi:hypothetical protein
MSAKIIAGALLALSAFASAHVAAAAEIYTGNAYDLDSGILLFREVHYRFAVDNVPQRLVLYRCPDGRVFARKQLHDDGNAQAPDFDLIDMRLNYREGVRQHGDRREVYVQRSADKPEQTAPLMVPPNGVIDDGFDEFVRQHWDALAAGGSLNLPFLVPSRRVFYPFKVQKVENAANPATLTIRLSLGAWYAFLLPHIDVVYDRTSRHLLHYEGLSNIRDSAGKSYKVRIEFATAAEPPPTPQKIDEAMAAPLTASCAVVRADTTALGAAQ